MDDMNRGKYKETVGAAIKPVFIIAIIYLVMESVGITCPIKFFTGISCAGCGMSRAWSAVLECDFRIAFEFHPLFFMPPMVIALFFLRSRMNTKVYFGIMYTAGAVFILVYLYRMFFVDGEIVVFEPEKGFFYRLLKNVLTK